MIMKMDTFENVDHEDFASGKSFVSLSTENLRLVVNYLLLFMRFLYRKSLFKIVLTRSFFFFICQLIFKMFAAHFATK